MYDEIYSTKQGFVMPAEHVPSEEDMLRYAQGDSSVVNELIEGLVSYIVNATEWFVSHSTTAQPYYEDCVSEALLALSKFTNDHLGEVYTPRHFMSAAKLKALSSVKDWLREMSVAVRIPHTVARDNNIQMVQNKLREDTSMTSENVVFDTVWFDHFITMLDPFERELVSMKIHGSSNREIGRRLNIGPNHVQAHLVRIGKFYLEGTDDV